MMKPEQPQMSDYCRKNPEWNKEFIGTSLEDIAKKYQLTYCGKNAPLFVNECKNKLAEMYDQQSVNEVTPPLVAVQGYTDETWAFLNLYHISGIYRGLERVKELEREADTVASELREFGGPYTHYTTNHFARAYWHETRVRRSHRLPDFIEKTKNLINACKSVDGEINEIKKVDGLFDNLALKNPINIKVSDYAMYKLKGELTNRAIEIKIEMEAKRRIEEERQTNLKDLEELWFEQQVRDKVAKMSVKKE